MSDVRDLSDLIKSQNIWKLYEKFKAQAEVIRCGFACFGVYEWPINESFDQERSESDLEHAAGVAALIQGISMWYPELISLQDRALYLELALIHDIGETLIGDIPDNGIYDPGAKAEIERSEFRNFIEYYPEHEAEELTKFYLEFQIKNTRRGQIMYLADKLEAVLQTLYYESSCRSGFLGKNLEYQPSHQDLTSLQVTDDDSVVALFACHFREVTEQFPEVSGPFLEVLKTATIDVRGKWFDWWATSTFKKPS